MSASQYDRRIREKFDGSRDDLSEIGWIRLDVSHGCASDRHKSSYYYRFRSYAPDQFKSPECSLQFTEMKTHAYMREYPDTRIIYRLQALNILFFRNVKTVDLSGCGHIPDNIKADAVKSGVF